MLIIPILHKNLNMNLFLKKVLVIFVMFYTAGIINCDETGELHLKCQQGELEGTFLTTIDGREIRAFMSIPYAEPPVGKLRFQAPVPLKKWNGILDATKVHEVCIQKDIFMGTNNLEGVEDCLFLNVYTPKKSEMKGPLSVMMFIHGGGYVNGAGNLYLYGPGMLLDQDIVLVVPNYRLGALGFLSTGDDVSPGNNGLKDQSLALKWITKNIHHFGGDPNQITVFGESAGAGSTHLQMISPMSRDMIKRAITQSGNALAAWSLAPPGEARKNAHKLAALLKCPSTPSQDMLECLQKVKAYRIVDTIGLFMEWETDPLIPFKPVIEHDHPGAFLSEHPVDIIKSGKMPKIPWMVGLTTDEGAFKAASLLNKQDRMDQLNDDFERIIPLSLLLEGNVKDVSDVTRRIREFYFGGNQQIGRETQQKLIDMYTDSFFLNSTDYSINLHRKYIKNDIYLYKFAYRGVASFTALFGGPITNYGVCHGDDLQYLFPLDALIGKLSDEDMKMAKYLTTLWTNFAKKGIPFYRNDDDPAFEWKTVKSDRLEYYHLEIPEKSYMGIDLFDDRVKFWRTLDIDHFNKDEL